MNIPIRMIGIATTIIWIFIIIFGVTALYSVKDLQFDFGQPQIGTTPDNKVQFSMCISILNKGLYNIGHFNATTVILNNQGKPIVHGSTLVQTIPRNLEVQVFHNLTFDVGDILQKDRRLLFHDQNLSTQETLGLWLAEVVPAQASANTSLPWGAPLNNFAVNLTSVTPYNGTHVRAGISLSFENHAFFDLTGTAHISMHNASNFLLGETDTAMDTPQHSAFSNIVDLYIPILDTTSTGHFHIIFSTPFFEYGPVVRSYE